MDEIQMRRLVQNARVARVGTTDERGRVHLVPVTFVVRDDIWYSPSDAGPRMAKRLRNLERDPRVTVLIDVYDEDWSKVWWVRLRGRGRVIEDSSERERARGLLGEKYPRSTRRPPTKAVGRSWRWISRDGPAGPMLADRGQCTCSTLNRS
jgi:PPOX class probable F420-dependent enzyme